MTNIKILIYYISDEFTYNDVCTSDYIPLRGDKIMLKGSKYTIEEIVWREKLREVEIFAFKNN